MPVEIADVAFEGNFINVHARDDRAAAYMVAGPQRSARARCRTPATKLHMVFAGEHAVVLADAAGGGAEGPAVNELLRRYGATLTGAFSALTAFWLLALVVLPYFMLFEYSFRPYLPVVEIGGPKDSTR